MKKMIVFLMLFTLLLSAACGKQPQSPTVPTESSEPVTEAPTQAPTEAPTQPVTEAPTEPVTEAPAEAHLSGKVAVLTADAPLENASAETVDANGNRILLDMELTLSRGTLVYVETQEQDLCTVVLLAGEPPHPRGQLPAELLRTEVEDLLQARQVILNDTPVYATAGDADFKEKRSGVAQVEARNAQWWKVSLPGGGEPFWVRQTDLTWEWPLPEHDEPVSEPPAIVEPEGFVSVAKLPGDVPGLKAVSAIRPLNEWVAVLLGEFGDGWRLMTYDYRTDAVLGMLSVECYEFAGAPALLDTDPYVLIYQDGRYDWKVTVDGDWQMTREKTDIQTLQRQMGGFTVEASERGITLDGKAIPALQANDRMVYTFIRVLNDHQLLYYAADRSISSLSHYGVYDHTTGETRAVTTMGQQVIGTWGENMLVGLWAENGWYNLGLIRLEDMRYTKLDVDSDTPDQAVSGIELNREGTRALTVRREEGGDRMAVYAVPEGDLLYAWTVPSDAEWHFGMASEQNILFWKKQSGGMTVWNVEY